METTIQTNNNDEINVLRIKLEIVEKELQLAISRAEAAESEVDKLQNLYKTCSHIGNNIAQSQSSHDNTESASVVICSYCGHSFQLPCESSSASASASITTACLPPPPPPPMPNFKPNPINFNQSGASLKDALTSFTLNNQRETTGDDNVSICSDPDANKSATGRFELIHKRTHIHAHPHLFVRWKRIKKTYCAVIACLLVPCA